MVHGHTRHSGTRVKCPVVAVVAAAVMAIGETKVAGGVPLAPGPEAPVETEHSAAAPARLRAVVAVVAVGPFVRRRPVGSIALDLARRQGVPKRAGAAVRSTVATGEEDTPVGAIGAAAWTKTVVETAARPTQGVEVSTRATRVVVAADGEAMRLGTAAKTTGAVVAVAAGIVDALKNYHEVGSSWSGVCAAAGSMTMMEVVSPFVI